jgi:diguanylate cyclase (GGDEF)-like protein
MFGRGERAPPVFMVAVACSAALGFVLYGYFSNKLTFQSISLILFVVAFLATITLFFATAFIIGIKTKMRRAETSSYEKESLKNQVELLSAIREISLLGVMDVSKEEASAEILNILADPLEARRISILVGASKNDGLKPLALRTRKRIYTEKIPLADWEMEAANLAYSQMRPVRILKKGRMLVAYPFGGDDGARGVILFLTTRKKAEESEKRMFHIVRAVSLALRMPALYEKAVYDVLTGLFTRRHLNTQLPLLFDESKRTGEPISVIMFDIDHFKTINDTYGHLFGDKVLRDVAGCIQESLRLYDSAYRYGGEEICVVLPRTKLQDALKIAQRLHSKIGAGKFYTDDGEEVKVTVSGGVASILNSDTMPTSLLERADAALYEAKESGRNRIIVAGSAAVSKNLESV